MTAPTPAPAWVTDLQLNGQASSVAVEPRQTLLDVLRRQLGLPGTKEVCGMGDCGACTVLVDGDAVYSCLVLAPFAYTNTGPAVAFRAPGYVEATFALESAMDELARRLEIDPIDLRRRNYTDLDRQRELPYSSPRALAVAYDRVAAVAGWDARPGAVRDRHPRGDLRRGRGHPVMGGERRTLGRLAPV